MTAAEPFPTEWTPEVARKLAVPFAPEQIGRKPQGNPKEVGRDKYERCNNCKPPQKAPPGHWHIDYVDHAIVTGRLNDVVGPHGWSYTITSVERDQQNNLTAIIGEMTVLGHTKGPEVGGPGGQAKEADDRFKSAISDYLKRAAARFGVGLDLWTKQALESAAHEQEQKPTAAAKESESGGASALKTRALDSAVAVAAEAPDPSQGPVADGTPPGFDHLVSVEDTRAWIKEHRELWPLIREDAHAQGIDPTLADLETLRELILAAWKVQQEAA